MVEEIHRGARGDADCRQKLVECTKCKGVSRCTPRSDFYEVPEDPEAHLCGICFNAHVAKTHGVGMAVKVPIGTDVKKGDSVREIKNFELISISLVDDPPDPHCKIDPKNVRVVEK